MVALYWRVQLLYGLSVHEVKPMLVRAMGTDKQRSRSLGIARGLTVAPYVFERASFGTSFKAACVNLPTNCTFVVIPIEGLRPVSYAKKLYTQGEQSSSVERLCLINA